MPRITGPKWPSVPPSSVGAWYNRSTYLMWVWRSKTRGIKQFIYWHHVAFSKQIKTLCLLNYIYVHMWFYAPHFQKQAHAISKYRWQNSHPSCICIIKVFSLHFLDSQNPMFQEANIAIRKEKPSIPSNACWHEYGFHQIHHTNSPSTAWKRWRYSSNLPNSMIHL